MTAETFFSYQELMDWIFEFADHNQDIVSMETIGRSNEGRDIQAVHITDKRYPIDHKEVVLIVLGRHGDELGTRVVGPAVLQWLASPEAKQHLKSQHILVVPVANPDACVKEIFGLPAFRLSSLEKNSLIKFGLKYIPDVVLDIHSVGKEKHGFNWGGLEAVISTRTPRPVRTPIF